MYSAMFSRRLDLCYVDVACVFLCNLSCAFVQEAVMCFFLQKTIEYLWVTKGG